MKKNKKMDTEEKKLLLENKTQLKDIQKQLAKYKHDKESKEYINLSEEYNKLLEERKLLLDKDYHENFIKAKAGILSPITLLPNAVGNAISKVDTCIKELTHAKDNKERIFRGADTVKAVGKLAATPVIYGGKFLARNWYLLLSGYTLGKTMKAYNEQQGNTNIIKKGLDKAKEKTNELKTKLKTKIDEEKSAKSNYDNTQQDLTGAESNKGTTTGILQRIQNEYNEAIKKLDQYKYDLTNKVTYLAIHRNAVTNAQTEYDNSLINAVTKYVTKKNLWTSKPWFAHDYSRSIIIKDGKYYIHENWYIKTYNTDTSGSSQNGNNYESRDTLVDLGNYDPTTDPDVITAKGNLDSAKAEYTAAEEYINSLPEKIEHQQEQVDNISASQIKYENIAENQSQMVFSYQVDLRDAAEVYNNAKAEVEQLSSMLENQNTVTSELQAQYDQANSTLEIALANFKQAIWNTGALGVINTNNTVSKVSDEIPKEIINLKLKMMGQNPEELTDEQLNSILESAKVNGNVLNIASAEDITDEQADAILESIKANTNAIQEEQIQENQELKQVAHARM